MFITSVYPLFMWSVILFDRKLVLSDFQNEPKAQYQLLRRPTFQGLVDTSITTTLDFGSHCLLDVSIPLTVALALNNECTRLPLTVFK